MTDEEKKVWDQTGWDLRVWNAKRRIPTTASQHTLPEWDEWIIAADAELKRLREAVEWACGCLDGNLDRSYIQAELRRRAGIS